MDETGTKPGIFKKLSLPLCLLSLVFYSFYIIILGWLLSAPIRSLLDPVLPVSMVSALASLSSPIIEIIFCSLSLIGAFQIVSEMQARTLPWKTALPLGFIIGTLVFSFSLVVLIHVSVIQQFLGIIIMAGFVFIPFSIVHLFYNIKTNEAEPREIGAIKSLCMYAGTFGLIIALLLVYSTLTYVPPVQSSHGDGMWNLGDPLILIEGLLFLLYFAFVLPLIGSYLLGLGLKYRQILPVPAGENDECDQMQVPQEEKK